MNWQRLYAWAKEVSKHFPRLSRPQGFNLALFSYGVIEARDCQLVKIAERLWWVGRADSVERRLQRLLGNAHLELAWLQPAWMRWVLHRQMSDTITVLVDETKLGDHLNVMMVGLAYRKRCIPLAWVSYPATSKGQVERVRLLLERLASVWDGAVQVQADRGIGTSPDLIRVVEGLGWVYLFRVQNSVHLRQADGTDCPLGELIQVGQHWYGQGWVFKDDGWRLLARVLLLWVPRYNQAWCLLTNDPQAQATDYGRRNWQEQSFRDLKRGGWRWNSSQVWQPTHADRLILLLALAYGWMVALGTDCLVSGVQQRLARGRRCRYSVFRLGLRL